MRQLILSWKERTALKTFGWTVRILHEPFHNGVGIFDEAGGEGHFRREPD